MFTKEDELAVIKYKCDNSLLFFTRYFFYKRFQAKYFVNSHHVVIAKALDAVLKGKIKRLIINMPPRFGKTELAVKNFIAKGFAINPKSEFLHVSSSEKIVFRNSQDIKDLITCEAYKNLYPQVKIDNRTNAKDNWATTAGGYFTAASANGQLAGFGAGKFETEATLFSGGVIYDDPLKMADADSEIIRDNINFNFDNSVLTRLNKFDIPVIIIMHRLHEFDLCGHLIDRDASEWHVIKIPVIDENNKPLWPEKLPLDRIEKLKRDNPIVFARQYMQEPQPIEGLLFDKKQIRFFNPNHFKEEDYESSLAYCDVADEGADNLAAVVGRNIGKEIYITDVVFNKLNTHANLHLVKDLCIRNKVSYIRVESNSMGAMFGRELSNIVKETTVQLMNNSKNKHTRIVMISDFVCRNCLFLAEEFQSEEYKKFMKELVAYKKEVKRQVRDDAPDALSGLADFIKMYLSHLYTE